VNAGATMAAGLPVSNLDLGDPWSEKPMVRLGWLAVVHARI
jgi:hypothetical protein